MNDFIIKGSLIINDTQPISGISNNFNFGNDPSIITTSTATKQYVDNKNQTGQNQVAFNSGGTLSGNTNLTYIDRDLKVNGNIKSINSTISNKGAQCIKVVNSTGLPSMKGRMVKSNKVWITQAASTPKVEKYYYRFNEAVTKIIEQSNGDVIVGGSFSSYCGTPFYRIMKMNSNGIPYTGFTFDNGFDNSVNDICNQSDGKILVGGTFTSYKGTPVNYMVRLNENGTNDTSFNNGGTGFNNQVHVITIQPSDQRILVGGYFTMFNDFLRNGIVRLKTDGTVDTSFTIGDGFSGYVNTICVQSDGKILVGGLFNTYSGVTLYNLCRLTSTGTLDPLFDINGNINGEVYTIHVQTDGKILVGGTFSSYSGETHNGIIRLMNDGTIDYSFDTGGGFNLYSFVTTIIETPSNILVGGSFTDYSGASYGYQNIISLNSNGSVGDFLSHTFENLDISMSVFIKNIMKSSTGDIFIGGMFEKCDSSWSGNIIKTNSGGTITSFIPFYNGCVYDYGAEQYGFSLPIGIVIDDDIPYGELMDVAIFGVCEIVIPNGSSFIPYAAGLSVLNGGGIGYLGYETGLEIGRSLESGKVGDTIKILLFNKNVN